MTPEQQAKLFEEFAQAEASGLQVKRLAFASAITPWGPLAPPSARSNGAWSECPVSPGSRKLAPYGISGITHSGDCSGELILAAAERRGPIADLSHADV
jgi:hypothetical protein